MMKTIYILFISVMACCNQLFAQEIKNDPIIYNVKAIVVNKVLIIEWDSDKPADSYWQIQASKDGKEFTSVGHVFGRNISNNSNLFSFKKSFRKTKTQNTIYRVVWMENSNNGIASKAIKII